MLTQPIVENIREQYFVGLFDRVGGQGNTCAAFTPTTTPYLSLSL